MTAESSAQADRHKSVSQQECSQAALTARCNAGKKSIEAVSKCAMRSVTILKSDGKGAIHRS
jgi:hypothetical protein